uniref:6,7-dimethyl-8-ribityllumazine synthase n=1 Tax=Lygus hesperus TaxID=30085 RepID=A0A0A9ZF84_LYGHE
MKVCGICLILATLGGSVWSTVFTPCSFARTLYKLLENEKRMLKEIPLLVCIAGYQRFDTDYLAGNAAKGNSGIEHSFHGVFGLLYSDMDESYPEIYHRLEERIRQDLYNFLEKALHVNDATTHPNYDFYKTICSKPHVRELSCRLNDYVLMNYKVYEPLNPGLLDEYRRTPHPTDDQPFIQTTESLSPSDQCDTSQPHTTPVIEPLVLHLVLFWMTGSIFYVVARYTYDYLHFKYLRNIIALG